MEKYHKKYQKLKDNYVALVTENRSLREQLQKYEDDLRTLRRGFSENAVYCGRNTTSRWRKKGEWDQTDLCNNDIVKSFCKNKLLPIYKFLGPEQLKYEDDLRTLRRGFSENAVYCGRNTTSRWRKKGEWDQTDLCNNDIIKSFCKNKLVPNYKFLGPEQLKYEDAETRSLCFKIYAEIQIPDTIKTPADKIFYWNQKLVPMINTKLVEVRSNFNSYIKRQYIGMYL